MNDNLKYIGENIRNARKNKKLTIEMLSEIIGISESFLGTIERGESSLSLETLIKVCNALNVNADTLITDGVKSTPSINNKKDTLITMLNSTNDNELDFLIEYVKLYRNHIKF